MLRISYCYDHKAGPKLIFGACTWLSITFASSNFTVLKFYGLLFLLLISCFSKGLWAQTGFQTDTVAPYKFLHRIIIKGQTKTHRAVILRELNVQPGDTIYRAQTESLTQINTQRLYTISIFNEVSISWPPAGSADSIDMLIMVKDRFPVFPKGDLEFADRNFNVWWLEKHHDLRRINLGLTLTDNNFRGRRENLSITGQAGYTQKIGISYSRPFIDKAQKHGIGVSFFGLQNREIAYNTINNKLAFERDDKDNLMRRFDAALWYSYRPEYAITHTLKFTWQHYWISRQVARINPEYLGNGIQEANNLWLQYRFEWNKVDNWNYPLTGERFIGFLDEKLLLPDHQFQSSLHLQFDRYDQPFDKWFTAFIFRGRISAPFDQPYIFRQNLGYEQDYMRGFEYYVLDGSAFALGRVDIKRCLVNYNIYLPVRYFELIPIKVYAKVFGDIGTSYNKFPEHDFLNNRWLYSAGFGLDIVTLYDIKVRIEYTFNNLGEKGLFLHKSGE